MFGNPSTGYSRRLSAALIDEDQLNSVKTNSRFGKNLIDAEQLKGTGVLATSFRNISQITRNFGGPSGLAGLRRDLSRSGAESGGGRRRSSLSWSSPSADKRRGSLLVAAIDEEQRYSRSRPQSSFADPGQYLPDPYRSVSRLLEEQMEENRRISSAVVPDLTKASKVDREQGSYRPQISDIHRNQLVCLVDTEQVEKKNPENVKRYTNLVSKLDGEQAGYRRTRDLTDLNSLKEAIPVARAAAVFRKNHDTKQEVPNSRLLEPEVNTNHIRNNHQYHHQPSRDYIQNSYLSDQISASPVQNSHLRDSSSSRDHQSRSSSRNTRAGHQSRSPSRRSRADRQSRSPSRSKHVRNRYARSPVHHGRNTKITIPDVESQSY